MLTNFDDCIQQRNSCHLIEQVGEDFYCDCHQGIKAKLCKHTVGMMFKCGILEVDSAVRSKPIGEKRKRGRPKKLPAALTRSPEPVVAREPVPVASYHVPSPEAVREPVPVASYHVQSPDVSRICPTDESIDYSIPNNAASPSSIVQPVTSSPTPITQLLTANRSKRLRSKISPLQCSPPSKRISRQPLRLTYGDDRNIINIKNIKR